MHPQGDRYRSREGPLRTVKGRRLGPERPECPDNPDNPEIPEAPTNGGPG